MAQNNQQQQAQQQAQQAAQQAQGQQTEKPKAITNKSPLSLKGGFFGS